MSRLWGIKSCSLDLSSDIDQSESLAGVTKREGRKKGEERSEIERCLIWATDCQAMMILELPGHQYCGSSLSLECDTDDGFRKTSTHLRTRYMCLCMHFRWCPLCTIATLLNMLAVVPLILLLFAQVAEVNITSNLLNSTLLK